MNKFIYKNQLWNYINLYIFGEYAALDDMLSIRKCNQVKNENITTTTKSYHIEPHLLNLNQILLDFCEVLK